MDPEELDSEDLGLPEQATGPDHRGVLAAVLAALLALSQTRAQAVPAPTPAAFGDRMETLLTDAHTRAVMLGRRLAGVPGPLSEDDKAFGAAMMEKQAPYLAGFVADLERGRYAAEDGTLRADAVGARAALYANALNHTAQAAWVAALPEDTLYTWNLGGGNNCEDCPGIADEGPYTAADLPGGGPGGGASVCLSSCQCFLETADGEQGFDPGGDETGGEE